MTVPMSPERKVKQSLEIRIERGLADKGWSNVSVLGSWPEKPRENMPWIAVEGTANDPRPIELGNYRVDTAYEFTLNIATKNEAQCSDLLFSLIGDMETDGVLTSELPVYEISNTYTGALIWTADLSIGRSIKFEDPEKPMGRNRAVVNVEIARF